MPRDYWFETSPTGQPRFVKRPTSRLRRSNTHDGSQSSRSRRVDFTDVTRQEYNDLLARERSLLLTNEELSKENWALRANYQAYSDELGRLQGLVSNLEYENGVLRSGGYYGPAHTRRDRHREDELRKLRNQNTRLVNEKDSLLARIKSLERSCRRGLRDGARHLGDWDLKHWKRKVAKLEDENEQLHHKLDSEVNRCHRLEKTNESLARQEMKWRREVDLYEAYMRRHGYSMRR